MAIEAGGEENLGHLKKDHLNYCTRLKMKQIEGDDAQEVTDIMYLELEGDEKIELFVWLLQTFKKSMGGKSPISIFTDQDATMNNVISQCTNKSVASSALPLSGLLKHASEVYTLSLFRDFEEEFGYSIATTKKLIWTQGNTQFYVVSIDEEPWSAQRVTYIHESQIVSCTCKNFEASGWLCYHYIRILHLHSVNRIPEQYIKKRWTKSAKSSVWNKLENEKPEEV
ncbi:protein FAR1-RELATED SEQUENCE 11-like [Spinacia oleracea]|uniref:Protein FAR1-RELATED SEQUENCE 11-like n=1 Tax=Spinacia oleracea TaxID=3562 RepID=A0ABM3QXH4_SPIOL|nr:protein FAR1-RELATED SEQUENCE 11-like [Spinacia oleracea]